MYHCGMRQMEERHVANQVDLMIWSHRLDLLAISNFKGEVQVHRLHWQKVWNLPPPAEDLTVRAMAWRPDGKALAIGYSSGSVHIVDVEDKEILDKYDLEIEVAEENDPKNYGISCLTWVVREGILVNAIEYSAYNDSSIFLQKPPSPNHGFKSQSPDDSMKDFKEIQEPTKLTILLLGYGTGYIYMSLFGRYPFGTIHLAQVARDDCGEYKILDICMSNDFSMMQVFYVDRSTNSSFVTLINTSVLSAYAEEMYLVANRHSQVVQLMIYLDQTMTSITEAWEHILLEMDTKMACYAASVPEGGVSADLLELLMLGTPSDELEVFLLRELTAKGLKKFGSSVELSYSTIQKLVLKQLNLVGQSLTYHLAELRGLTRIPDRYKILGLEETVVSEAIKASCAFLNKCLELQQVIDGSMRNYKTFFRWLFVVIVRLLDEQTPSEIVKITQQDLTHIAEFLYNFDNIQVETPESPTEKPVKFNLERLGQYLQDQNLTILPEDDDNPWHKFLKENPCLATENETIYSMSEFRKFSLVQQQQHLKDAIIKVFDVSDKDIGQYFSVLYNIRCYNDKPNETIGDNLRVSQMFDATQQRFMLSFIDTRSKPDEMCFMSMDTKDACGSTATKYYFSSSLIEDENGERNDDEKISILGIQFYSPEYLSVLTSHPSNEESTIFIQLPLKIAIDNSAEFNIRTRSCVFNDKITRSNMSPLLDQGVFKVLDKMDGFRIAVSGGRKVAVVLSKSLRKVRVFEMEVDGEEEEDETLDVTPQSHTTKSDQDTPEKQDTSVENATF